MHVHSQHLTALPAGIPAASWTGPTSSTSQVHKEPQKHLTFPWSAKQVGVIITIITKPHPSAKRRTRELSRGSCGPAALRQPTLSGREAAYPQPLYCPYSYGSCTASSCEPCTTFVLHKYTIGANKLLSSHSPQTVCHPPPPGLDVAAVARLDEVCPELGRKAVQQRRRARPHSRSLPVGFHRDQCPQHPRLAMSSAPLDSKATSCWPTWPITRHRPNHALCLGPWATRLNCATPAGVLSCSKHWYAQLVCFGPFSLSASLCISVGQT